ncbi:28S ribosomal protein S29, mitochondrial-like isoform X2 [Oncorhynchus keta]|uniref:28S ribosomal protein S29, mitochondrial-like isoform X2 n=1 Tax=Oncorhynchus keta TaxID=8018 RepID=UPI00227CB56D|nr:28S ribosomal protein S29, mitochondrial-like isoform X2 [Oncorhynchus keta]
MINNDWCGGAVIATLSQTGSLYAPSSAYLPQELLGEEGFDSMDPFVPVPVSSTVRRSLRAVTSTTWTATGYNTHTVRQRKGRKN